MSAIAFQMPKKVLVEKIDDFQGTFVFQPLEKGYGVTLGNSLRRVLLSSLEGYAITSIKIAGVQHEFSTIEGVREDVTSIILNLKQIRFKPLVDVKEEFLFLSITPPVFKASDIEKATTAFEVLNPDIVICTLDKFVNLDLEIKIEKGRGYLSAEENQSTEQAIGLIPIDAIFTPIKKVEYRIENMRVSQKTDYEKLIISLHTDGSIYPEAALQEAAAIIIRHFSILVKEGMSVESHDIQEESIEKEKMRVNKLLNTPIHELEFSARVLNCLKVAGITILGDLTSLKLSDMMKFRNFGKKSREEIEQLLKKHKLNFEMDLSKYKIK